MYLIKEVIKITKTNYWVTKHTEGWQAKSEGAERASGVFDTQKEAENYARNILENKPTGQGGELITQGRDGEIRSKDTINSYDPSSIYDTEN